jgi:predicted adenine nucleotide alpha hydrolase (AANH) superfamily ATPase
MKMSKEEKAMWLEDWKKSGKKAWAYAKENGMVPQTFCGWVKSETKNESGFVEIPKAAYQEKQVKEILIEKGGIKIHIPLSISTNEFRLVMEGLRAVL